MDREIRLVRFWKKTWSLRKNHTDYISRVLPEKEDVVAFIAALPAGVPLELVYERSWKIQIKELFKKTARGLPPWTYPEMDW